MKYAGAVYEARTYGSVRGMRHEPHPTRCELFCLKTNYLAAHKLNYTCANKGST
jgi:hypothetical protein